FLYFFFNDTATTEIYTLSLHDALPISAARTVQRHHLRKLPVMMGDQAAKMRSEEHTSELQSHVNIVCRLLLEKKQTRVSVFRVVRYRRVNCKIVIPAEVCAGQIGFFF